MSGSNLYHVMLRGNGKQRLFLDDEDNEQFLAVLRHYKDVCGYQLYAYCLMGNHVHLLMRVGEGAEGLAMIFRRIGAKYGFWYNKKYERVGHLFQDRYKSEAVEDDGYLLTVLRYIHNNPVKAGLARAMQDYKYASFAAYLNPKPDALVDTDCILGMMGADGFVAFHGQENFDQCLDMKPTRRSMDEDQARALVAKVAEARPAEAFSARPRGERIEALKALAGKGLTYRQICRLTGQNVSFIQRAVRNGPGRT